MATTAARPKRPPPPATRRPRQTRQPPAPHNRPPHLAREKPHTKEGEKERERGSGALIYPEEDLQARRQAQESERERAMERGKRGRDGLTFSLSLSPMHRQTKTAQTQRQTRHTEVQEVHHGGRTKRETHTREARNTHTHTHTHTHSPKQRTHTYRGTQSDGERETHTQHAQHAGWMGGSDGGETKKQVRNACGQCACGLARQQHKHAHTPATGRCAHRRPRLLHGGGVAWRAVWAAADMSARGRRHTHCYLRKEKSCPWVVR